MSETLKTYIDCPVCEGEGRSDGRALCAVCGATGRVELKSGSRLALLSFARNAAKHLMVYELTKGPPVLIEPEEQRLLDMAQRVQSVATARSAVAPPNEAESSAMLDDDEGEGARTVNRSARSAVVPPDGQQAMSIPRQWHFCPRCGKRIMWLTAENRGMAPLPDIKDVCQHTDYTPICSFPLSRED